MIGKEKMGITVHYRGVMKDLERVEEFEDRVIDLALEVGASAQLWRSASVDDASRVVRGLMLDLSPDPATADKSFAEWLLQNRDQLGDKYASELARHYR